MTILADVHVARALTDLAPLVAVAAVVLAIGGSRCVIHALAGASSRRPEELKTGLSPAAQALVDRAYSGVNAERLLDYHVHIVGMGEGGSGCFVHPKMLTWSRPFDRVKFLFYKSASRIRDEGHADSQYVARLADLARHHRGRLLVLAFDRHYDAAGCFVPEKTEFHVPNEHAIRVAAAHPDVFVAAGSVHPYRADAIDELERCAAAGVRIIKWLPNAMGIDPSDAKCRPYYDRMRALGMALLSHGGEEKAVEAEEDQRLGNPLLLRAALEAGVKVIVAHCAGLGDDEDLDAPARPRVPSWTLFLRMMDDPRWNGLLFGDISAATQANRIPEPLATMIRREDLHARLVNGSDYPLPAVNVVIRTGKLVSLGMLTEDERTALNELYDVDPLVFDFALKRSLCVRDKDGTEHRFAPSVFEEHPALAPTR